MFKLIAVIYVLVNGVPQGEPHKTSHKMFFENLEQCVAYKDSDAGKDSLTKLSDMVRARLDDRATFAITLSCEKEELKYDGSI